MFWKKLSTFTVSAAVILTIFISATFTANAQDVSGNTDNPQYNQDEEYHPQITGFSPVDKGVRISWHSDNGAVDFILCLSDGNGWKELIHTKNNYYFHKNLTSNTEYVYSLRAFDKNGNEIGSQSEKGFSFRYFDAPVLTNAVSVYGGMKVSWQAVKGASSYIVYRKDDGVWETIGKSSSSSFTDTDVKSGQSYSYTVSCTDENNEINLSRYDSNGINGMYVAAPEIRKSENLAGGVKLSWSKTDSASKYRIFLKQNDKWIKLADTSSASYVHDSAISCIYYTYTVRALDKSNNYLSGYNKNGFSTRYFSAPELTSAKSIYGGVKISWDDMPNAPGYRVYRKTESGIWTILKSFTTNTSFTDKTTKDGTKYTYTVRVTSAGGKSLISPFDKSGVSTVYRKAPEITDTVNYSKLVRIYFDKVLGAVSYRVFVRDGDSWKKIGNTKDNYFEYKDVKNGEYYTYTVRALDSKGSYLTSYNKAGYTAAFYSPPAISSVTPSQDGYTIKWKAVADVPTYRVYRKTICGDWKYIGISESTYFNDTKLDTDQLVSYTVRCRSTDNRILSAYREDEVYYYNGQKAEGSFTFDSKKYAFTDGKYRDGFITVNKKTYFYNSNGNIVKGLVVGNKTDGYYYTEKDGHISYQYNGLAQNKHGYWYCKNSKVDFNYRNAITYNGSKWLVLNGKAKRITTEADWTLYRAFKELEKCTSNSMSKYEKLRAAYNHVMTAYSYKNQRIPHYHGSDWPIVYANDMFIKRAGNCFSYASAFAYMAKAIGYENVYVCNGQSHGWVEINGKVFDPQAELTFGKTYFNIRYGKYKKPAYKKLISAGYSWMKIKI